MSQTKITRMRCNHLQNPLGFELGRPRLSWVTVAPGAQKQKAARIRVAADPDWDEIVFDSGRDDTADSLGFVPDFALSPCQRYFWQVTVWTDDGDCVDSPVAWFETARMDQLWQAEWITPEPALGDRPPLLRKGFEIKKEIVSARAYVCGLGLYELWLNGARVGDEYFTPYCNAYDQWLQYQTFEITDKIMTGPNAVGAMLGEGWYKGRFGFQDSPGNIYGDRLAFLCEIVIDYADGSEERVCSDPTWQAVAGPIQQSSLYDGEIYDARAQKVDWAKAENKGSDWLAVETIDIGYEKLQARLSPPVRTKEKIKPTQVIHTPKGETVLDMGQNMVGWLQFRTEAPAGTRISLWHGEALQDGCFYRENLRTAKAEYHFIADGRPHIVQPYFTFFGFRYVKVEGWPGVLNPNDFTGCVVYSDLIQTGQIETSNPWVNRLFQNALWSQKGNFLDVPTDCPQRDERMGWTGDAQVFSGTACFNMDTNAFFHKYLHDLALEQHASGAVPHFVPTFKMGQGDDNSFVAGGSSAWGEAATIIPWNLFIHYGDRAILTKQFTSMKRWVNYIHSQDQGDCLWQTGFHFGDWLALDGPDPFSPMGGTLKAFIASALYAYSAKIVSQTAAVLGEKKDRDHYAKLAREVKDSIGAEFFTPRGRLAIDTQTAHVLALFLDLMPEAHRQRTVESLCRKLEENGGHLKTGFVGTPYLCRTLSENGYHDLACRLLLGDDFPSWLYAVKMGATTIWERWNSLLPDGHFGELGMNSLNHYAYGSIVEWMYRHLGGLKPQEKAPGFRRIDLAPQPTGLLQKFMATVDSAAGRFISAWTLVNDELCFHFEIPFDTLADLRLPDASVDRVSINGQKLSDTELAAHPDGHDLLLELAAGVYEIVYRPRRSYRFRYSLDHSFNELCGSERLRKLLSKHLPNLVEAVHATDRKGLGLKSLREHISAGEVKADEESLARLEHELQQVWAWEWHV